MQLAGDQTLDDLRAEAWTIARGRGHPYAILRPFEVQSRAGGGTDEPPYHAQPRLRLRERAELDGICGQLMDDETHEFRRLGIEPNRGSLNHRLSTVHAANQQFIEHQGLEIHAAGNGGYRC